MPSIRLVFAVIAVKHISVNCVAKLNESKDLPKCGDSSEGKFSKKLGKGLFVILAPIEVDALKRKVTKGKLPTIDELRCSKKTQVACPSLG